MANSLDAELAHKTLYERRLDWQNQEIRLIEILPRTVDDATVHVRLQYTSLETNNTYTALSYTWGDPTVTRTINVNGKACEVTTNLEAALREFRSSQYHQEASAVVDDAGMADNGDGQHHIQTSNELVAGPLYWIDALSINQQDDLEKADQVRNMGAIFRKASLVLVWLGEADEHTSIAFEELRRFASIAEAKGIKDHQDMNKVITNTEYDEWLVELCWQGIISRLDQWTSVDTIFQRSWWDRAWIIQEIAIAETACVACGPERLQWSHIMCTLTILEIMRWKESHLTNKLLSKVDPIMDHAWMISTIARHLVMLSKPSDSGYYYGTWPLLYILLVHNRATPLMVTDLRDRIYSLLSLVAETEKDRIQVRYDSDWTSTHLYTEVTQQILRVHGTKALTLLACDNERTSADLPIWVLDWNAKRLRSASLSFESTFRANAQLDNRAESFRLDPAGHLIHLRVLVFDTIASVGRPFSHARFNVNVDNRPHVAKDQEIVEYVAELRSFIAELRRMLQSSACAYQTAAEIEAAICRTMVMDCNAQPPSAEVHASYKLLVDGVKAPDDCERPGEWLQQAVLPFVGECRMRCRTPFVSSRGYLGTGQPSAGEGDMICILPDMRTPFVFHPLNSGQYECRGNAFVQGIMYGEFATGEGRHDGLTWLDVC